MDIIRAMNPDIDPSRSPGTDITMSLGDNQVPHVSPLHTVSPLQIFFCPQKINHSVSFSFSLPYHTIHSLTLTVPVHQEWERTCVFSSQPRVDHLWIACGSFFLTQSNMVLGRTSNNYPFEMPLWWRRWDEVVYEYSHKLLGISLTLCPFRRAIIVGSTLDIMTCLGKILGSSSSDKNGLVAPITVVSLMHH